MEKLSQGSLLSTKYYCCISPRNVAKLSIEKVFWHYWKSFRIWWSSMHMSRDVVSNCIITELTTLGFATTMLSILRLITCTSGSIFLHNFCRWPALATHSGQTRERNGGDEDGKVSYTLLARKCIEWGNCGGLFRHLLLLAGLATLQNEAGNFFSFQDRRLELSN